MSQTPYDTIIIGGGQAGVPLAHALAKSGQRVALVERSLIGGSCVNFGCTPTKAVIASARLVHQMRRAGEYGMHVSNVKVDFPAVLERARRIAAESRTGLDSGFDKIDSPKLMRGHASLDGQDDRSLFRVRVGVDTYTAKHVVLNTGTRSSIPSVEGLDEVPFIHAGNWLEFDTLPEHLAILGGGYIALEMSQFYHRMGSRVTVIEDSERVAKREDEDISKAVQKSLEAEGITFRFHTRTQSIKAHDGGITLTFDEQNGAGSPTNKLEASHLFVATGRQPNTDDLGLETLGVSVDEHGIIKTDERLQTNVEGIWVAGDIRGGAQFTHTAWDDYRILESQLVGDKSRTTDRIIPYAMFTDPELGRVGMTEREARAAGKEIKISRYEMRKNGKAREIGEPNGFIKVIVDAGTDKILGAAVFAHEAAEIIHSYVDLMNADAPYTTLRDAVHIHPTLAEAVQSAVKAL